MSTMSDDGERTCPLCMEEMDLTDQQLKPCKCGYEICVWCWHHIIEMAEKEGSEGRCPACRTSYDKQRIVGMAANCKKMVSEISADKKLKSQKTKSKTSIIEDRKHLSSVRVVQRNLVCIMGVPNSLADENILERKEYFGQYGKIMKVSLSRAAGTTIQQAPNSNTFSVYITYAREEEAIRCIQAVHYFVLEGKPLRACFGTTKYCYAWLRNMACSNPDCLYLHDIGSHEDSFTKDEIISAYTRSRVPQVSSNNLQPRAGNVLPPLVDDLYNNGAVYSKHSPNSPLNNATNQVKASIGSSGSRSTALPAGASWGLRIANSRQPSSTTTCLQTPLKQQAEVFSSTSNAVASSAKQTSAWHDDQVMTTKKPDGNLSRLDSRSRPLKPLKHGDGKDILAKVSDICPGSILNADHASSSAWDDDVTTAKLRDGNHTMQMNGISRSNEISRPSSSASGSDDPTELVWDEARHSAWDDDTVTMSNIPSDGHNSVHTNGFKSDSSELNHGIFPLPTSDVESRVLPDAVCTSVVSSSGTSRQLSPLSENGGLPLSTVNTDQLYIATSKGADGGSCSSLPVSAVNSDHLYITTSKGAYGGSSSSLPDDITHITEIVNRYTESLSAGLLSVKADSDLRIDHVNMSQHLSLASIHTGNHGSLHSRVQQSDASVTSDEHSSVKLLDGRAGVHKQVLPSSGNGLEGALAAADDHKQRVPIVLNAPSGPSYDVCLQNISDNLTNISNVDTFDKQFPSDETGRTMGAEMKSENNSFFMNGHKEEIPSGFAKLKKSHQYTDNSYAEKNLGLSSCLDKLPNVEKTSTLDMEEKTIVSDMFSSDFDPWDDSWSSANNFAKLLAQMNKPEGSSNLPSTWDLQNANQSRFSFARQENQVNLGDSSYSDATHAQQLLSIKQEPYGNFFASSLSHNSFDSSNSLGRSSLTDVTAGVSRTKMSAPPGFSVPNRAPPPGFSSQGRYEQTLNTHPETQLLLGNALQNQFQVHPSGNAGDVEFIDPAILAVGKGRLPLGVNNTGLGARSTFVPQFSSAEGDARIQLLMQQSVSANQDPRIPNHIGDRFMRFDDAYISSRFPSQNSSSFSPFAQISHQQHSHILTSQWNGWNDMPIGNSMGAADALRNDMFGRGGYFHVNEEPKFHLSSAADIYNRAFGI